jgi:hypothetical protein
MNWTPGSRAAVSGDRVSCLDLREFMGAYKYPKPRVRRRAGSKAHRVEQAILREIDRLGDRVTTIRFLFYRLVAESVIPKAYRGPRQPSQDVSVIAADLREAGVIPLGQIVDDGRSIEGGFGWANLRAAALHAVQTAELDPWSGNAPIPFLVVESRSLARVLDQATSEYRLPIAALGGQSSLSFAYELGQALPEAVRVIYLGDLDLAGGHIESSVRERALAYSGWSGKGTWERLALTEEQVEMFDLPVIEKYDARTRKHYPAVETEALGQDLIERLVRDALNESLKAHGVTLPDLDVAAHRQRSEITLALRRQD